MKLNRSELVLVTVAALCLAFAGFAVGHTYGRHSKTQNGVPRMPWSEHTNRSIIDRYMSGNEIRKLHIGAGTHNLPGWLNTDIEPQKGQAYLDAAKHFPLPNASVHYIFSEHMIEHITYEEGVEMLKECYRVLAPGGKIRTVTPNLTKFLYLYREPKTTEMRSYIAGKLKWHGWPETPEPETYVLNQQLRDWGHQFLYTPKLLRSSMESAGLEDVREYAAGSSDDPALSGLELRVRTEVSALNAYEAMVLQAVRR